MSEELVGAAALVGRYAIALVFLVAAAPKLLQRTAFEQAISNYALLPRFLVGPVATWLPRLELTLALTLLLGIAVTPSALAVGGLLIGFSAAVGLNLARGREISCGCSGTIAPRKVSWGLVAGDLALAGVAVLVALADPGVLAVYDGSSSNRSTLGADGLAAVAVAGTLVLGYALVGSWIRVHAASLLFASRTD